MKQKALLLLFVIYIAFIALGLPDALLGSAWNLVRIDLGTSLGTLGIMTFIVYVMSIFATFNAPKLLRTIETKKIAFVSILMTGFSLLMISRVNEFYQMLFFAVPLGLGAGAIDVSLNHYLATNYKASHMNYLHSFYGIGVTFGPTVMAYTLKNNSWRLGYVYVGVILLAIAVLMLISFKLWKKEHQEDREIDHAHIPLKVILKTRGAISSILIFLFYVHIETLGGIWIASYFFIQKGVSFSTAALFASTFYLALTVGRLLSGFVSSKVLPNSLIKIGESIILLSGLLMIFNFNQISIYFVIVFLFGFGCAPIFPNMMYMNSHNFKAKELSKIMSLQMAVGYSGIAILTPLAGLIFDKVSISLFPYFIVLIALIIIIITKLFFRKVQGKSSVTQ